MGGYIGTINLQVYWQNSGHQYVLQRARDIKASGSHVPVKLVHEPRNPCDSRAIAFMCEVDRKWQTIGYVVLMKCMLQLMLVIFFLFSLHGSGISLTGADQVLAFLLVLQ